MNIVDIINKKKKGFSLTKKEIEYVINDCRPDIVFISEDKQEMFKDINLQGARLFTKNDILLSDIVGFFGHMGESTATLWEYRERHGSRDHGFASLALVAIRQALGIS